MKQIKYKNDFISIQSDKKIYRAIFQLREILKEWKSQNTAGFFLSASTKKKYVPYKERRVLYVQILIQKL